ncbi:MAG TPA: DNA repair protein RecN [Thermoanaerobaculia bacterium]|nr:DNA repair protein RecN [Thermoanaerobaculia bacterium]
MLTSLRVRDLAVLEDVEVAFGEGLTVLTGETGAGKSLVVDAVMLLAGGRADPALVRAGAERLVVEGAFDCDDAEARRSLVEAGLLEEGSGPFEVVVRREVAAGGKGRLLVNGSPAALKTLQEIAPRLLVLYGQAEARDLLDPDAPRQLLDRFAGLGEKAAESAARFREFAGAERDLARLEEAAKNRVQRLELLDFQIGEIDKVGPKEGEDEEISSERKRLASVEKVGQLLATVTGALESDEGGAIPAASAARRALQQLEEISSSYAARSATLAEAIERLKEVAFETSRDLGSLEADPARAAFVAERLDALAKLKRKYGATLSEVLERRTSLGRERDELLDLEGAVKKAEGTSEKAFSAYRRAALELSAAREAAAPRLGRAVEAQLRDLAFLKSSFSILVTRREEEGSRFAAGGIGVAFGAHGIDHVQFAFAPNPGEPARPLQKIASGGELSRVQLALAAALAAETPDSEDRAATRRRGGPVRTFVFDEVDAGVSGATAEAVGRKLRGLAAHEQILVVTHLAQVAAAGECHLSVSKEASKGRTRTRVEALDGAGRVEAVAALLAGSSVGEPARAQARQLLSASAKGGGRPRPSGRPV